MPTGQNYVSTAPQTNLVGGINNSQTNNITVASFTGFPATPFTMILDIGTASQEAVDVLAVSGNTVTNSTRGVDGTSAQAHSNNATVTHAAIGRDFREARAHIDASASNDSTGHSVHGLASGSSVVGTTDTQTLTNKTLTAPVITGSGGTLTLPAGPSTLADLSSAQTFTNKTLTSPTINNPSVGTSGAGAIPLTVNHAASPTVDIAQFQINGVAAGGMDKQGGLYVAGVSPLVAKARIVGATTGGPPTTGTWALGDVVADTGNGINWLCVTAGTPGTWRPSGMAVIGTDSVGNLSLSGIPAYFTNLRVEWQTIGGAAGGGNGFDEMFIRFNADTAANYTDYHVSQINGTTLAGNANAAVSNPRCGVTTNGATNQAGGMGVIDIPYYSGGTQKQYVFQSGAASGVGAPNNNFLMQGRGLWSGTAAINKIDIQAVSGTAFATSNMTVYGC